MPPEWTLIPTESGGRRGVTRPPEWRKTPGGGATEWEGESSCLRTTRSPERQKDPGETKPWEPSQRPNNDREGEARAQGTEETRARLRNPGPAGDWDASPGC